MCLLELLAAIPEEAANRKAQSRPMSCCGQVASTYLRSDHSRGSNDLARSNLHFGNCSRKEQFWRFDLHKDVLKVSYQVMVGAERRASFAASMLGSPADSLVMLILAYIRMATVRFGSVSRNRTLSGSGSAPKRFGFNSNRFGFMEPNRNHCRVGSLTVRSYLPYSYLPYLPYIMYMI